MVVWGKGFSENANNLGSLFQRVNLENDCDTSGTLAMKLWVEILVSSGSFGFFLVLSGAFRCLQVTLVAFRSLQVPFKFLSGVLRLYQVSSCPSRFISSYLFFQVLDNGFVQVQQCWKDVLPVSAGTKDNWWSAKLWTLTWLLPADQSDGFLQQP